MFRRPQSPHAAREICLENIVPEAQYSVSITGETYHHVEPIIMADTSPARRRIQIDTQPGSALAVPQESLVKYAASEVPNATLPAVSAEDAKMMFHVSTRPRHNNEPDSTNGREPSHGDPLQTGFTPIPAPGLILCYGSPSRTRATEPVVQRQLLFTSQGKTGMINSDGTGLRYFEFDVPNQAKWQPGPLFSDGKRIVFSEHGAASRWAREAVRGYYTQTPTHIWAHDLVSGSLEELCTEDRIAPFEILRFSSATIAFCPGGKEQGWADRLHEDGWDGHEGFYEVGEGIAVRVSLRHDGKRVAFHLASPQGYQVWTSDLNGENRVKIKGEQGHIVFGTSWSPDDQLILYVDCIPQTDPAH